VEFFELVSILINYYFRNSDTYKFIKKIN